MIKGFSIFSGMFMIIMTSCHDSPAYGDQPVIFQILKIDTIEDEHFKNAFHLLRFSITMQNKLKDTLWLREVISTDSFLFTPSTYMAVIKTTTGFEEIYRHTIREPNLFSYKFPIASDQKDTFLTDVLVPQDRWHCNNPIFLSLRFKVTYKGSLTPEFEKNCHIAYKDSITTECQMEFVNVISKKDCSKFEFIPGKLSEIVKKYDSQYQK